MQRIHIGTDHAGLEASHAIIEHLRGQGYEVIDHGPSVYDPEDDYPAFCIATGQAVVTDQEACVDALGIVLGGSGNGEQIAANKVIGVRAALVWNDSTARLARQHNDANVIALGARENTPDEILRFVDLFIREPFSEVDRHARRIAQIAVYEHLAHEG